MTFMTTVAPFTTRRRPLCAGLAAAAAFVLIAAAAPPRAARGAQSGKPNTASAAARRESLTQVDGITNRVVDALWVRSDHFWHDGDYNRIIAINRVIVEADPHFVDAYQNGSYILWSLGDVPGADAFLRLGVARNPKRYEIYSEMGQHLFRTKRFRDAVPYLQKATAYKSAPPSAWGMLAHCYERVGRLDDAIAAWQQIVKRFPTFPPGPPNLRRTEALKSGGANGSRPG